jgi:hypothetical protein
LFGRRKRRVTRTAALEIDFSTYQDYVIGHWGQHAEFEPWARIAREARELGT